MAGPFCPICRSTAQAADLQHPLPICSTGCERACEGRGAAAPAYPQQISDQAQAIAEKLADSGQTTLAVVDFTDLQGNVTELGRFLAEELSIGLAGLDLPNGGFEVVDRTHLKAILQENKLSATGLIDPSTAREVGRIAGVGALITGTVTPLGDSVRLAVKVLDTESARIITSSTADIPKTRAIEELLRREIVGGARPVRQAGSTSSGTTQSTKEAGFLFQLRRCTLSGSTLSCVLTVTNEQEDCDLQITNQSRVISAAGDQFDRPSVRFGSQTNAFWVTENVVNNVPTNVTLTFQEVASGISRLALLEVGGTAKANCTQSGGRHQEFRAQYREIPVYRE